MVAVTECAECDQPFRKGDAAIRIPALDAVWCLECFSTTVGGSVSVHARVYPECSQRWHDMYDHPSTLIRPQTVRRGNGRDVFRRVRGALEGLPAVPREFRVVERGSRFAVALVVGTDYEDRDDAEDAAVWLTNRAGLSETVRAAHPAGKAGAASEVTEDPTEGGR